MAGAAAAAAAAAASMMNNPLAGDILHLLCHHAAFLFLERTCSHFETINSFGERTMASFCRFHKRTTGPARLIVTPMSVFVSLSMSPLDEHYHCC